jgi:hypothetical protein
MTSLPIGSINFLTLRVTTYGHLAYYLVGPDGMANVDELFYATDSHFKEGILASSAAQARTG